MVLIDAVLPRSWTATDSRARRLALDIALMFAFAGFVALCAQIVVRLPWTTVPITAQTFGVLVTGGSLGAWRGAGSLLIYMLLGTVGAPVFAPGNAGLSGDWDVHFIAPWKGTGEVPWDLSSGGYIVGFIFAAFLTGYLAQRAWDRKPWNLLGMLAGNIILYVPGLLWLYYLIATDWVHPVGRPLGELIAGSGDWDKTLKGGLYPFIVGDLMKLYLASLTLPMAWALVNRIKGEGRRGK
jgi:biotin transport system substrate-specific component